MAPPGFVVGLTLEDFRERLAAAFAVQEELIRKKTPTGLRGFFTGLDEFWIQVPDPHRSNQWNDALLAAPRIPCRIESSRPGEVRIVLALRRKTWSLAATGVGCLAAASLLVALLAAMDVFGQAGPVRGLRRLVGLLGAALLCVLLGTLGAWLWGRPDPTPVRFAVLRAVGLFGAGRARPS